MFLHNATLSKNIVFKCKFYHIHAKNKPKSQHQAWRAFSASQQMRLNEIILYWGERL